MVQSREELPGMIWNFSIRYDYNTSETHKLQQMIQESEPRGIKLPSYEIITLFLCCYQNTLFKNDKNVFNHRY